MKGDDELKKIISAKILGDVPIERMPEAMIEGQTLNIDSVSGATYTSNAILTAVEDCVVQAGGHVEVLKLLSNKEDNNEQTKIIEKETEVVVIGSGGAGLSAAVKLGELNTDCIILEKMPTPGGNTMITGAAYNAVDPEKQKEQGIEDSIELHIKQTYEGGDKIANIDLVTILAENALNSIKWLESYGVEFKEDIVAVIGAMWPRTHYPINNRGSDFINVLVPVATEQYNQELMLDTKVSQLLIEDGRVVGVKAESTINKTTYLIKATKGVIIASGGFGANIKRCREYNPNIPEDIRTSNHPGATGDGIDMAVAIGAATEGIEYIQMLPIAGGGMVTTAIDNQIFVNQEGNRFVREDGRRDTMSNAVLEQPGKYFYMIADQNTLKSDITRDPVQIEQYVKYGKIKKADTLLELAELIEADPGNLVKAVEEFNKHVETGEIDEFGREVYQNKINTPPFYASARQTPKLHYTMGGLRINTKAHVLDNNNNPIPGLYAAGEVTGGIHGSNRLGGNAVADIFVFGRIAAESLVAENYLF